MSWQYGWNAQSALLPEQKKYIKVDDKGLHQIQSAMLLIKNKNKKQEQSSSKGKYYSSKKFPETNQNKQKKQPQPGIQERIKRDQQAHHQHLAAKGENYQFVKQKLKDKAKTYDKMKQNPNPKNHSSLLVDFVAKSTANENQSEKQQFERLKRQFYEGKLKDVLQRQQDIAQGQDTDGVNDQMRQNLAWEKEVLNQLKGGDCFDGQGQKGQKQKVAQSYDKKLSAAEKQALQSILKEKLQQKTKRQEIRKSRQQTDAIRQAKLRKMIKKN